MVEVDQEVRVIDQSHIAYTWIPLVEEHSQQPEDDHT